MKKLIDSLLNQYPTLRQLIRYGIVGVMTNVSAYVIFLIIVWLGFPPKLAMTVLYFTCTTFSFLGMKHWAFANQERSGIYKIIFRFFSVYILGYVLNLMLLTEFAEQFGYSYQVAQAIAIVFMVAYFFIALKLFVFPVTKTVMA